MAVITKGMAILGDHMAHDNDRTGKNADSERDARDTPVTRRNVLRASAAMTAGVGFSAGTGSAAHRTGSEHVTYPSQSWERSYEAFYEPRPEFDEIPYEECIPEVGSQVRIKSLAEYGTTSYNPGCEGTEKSSNNVRYDVWRSAETRIGRFWINANRHIPQGNVVIKRVDECGERDEYDVFRITFEHV